MPSWTEKVVTSSLNSLGISSFECSILPATRSGRFTSPMGLGNTRPTLNERAKASTSWPSAFECWISRGARQCQRLPANPVAALRVLAVSANLVAYAADGSNEGSVVSGIYFAAKIVDVHIHDVGHCIKIEFPDLLDDGGTGNRLALVAHKVFKQSEFLRAEIDVVTSAAHGVAHAVHFEVINLENGARGPAPSAQNSADARGEFGEGKRFCHVIVRAGIKPADALLDHAGAGHDDHRQIRPPGANPAKDIQPADSREIEIQNHEIVCRIGSQLLRLRPIRNNVHRELLLLEPLVQKFRKRRVIFGDKNAHRLTRTT